MMDDFLNLLGWTNRPEGEPVAFSVGGARYDRAELRRCASALAGVLRGESAKVVLYSQDPWLFTVGLFAGIATGKTLYLPGYVGEGTVEGDFADAFLIGDDSLHGFNPIPNLIRDARQPAHEPERTMEGEDSNPESASRIILLTSGSTGEPERIVKKPSQLLAETAVLAELWADEWSDSLVCSTVSHQHLYGLLFSVLVPLAAGVPFLIDRVEYPEFLTSLPDRPKILVSSPAFLRRMDSKVRESIPGFRAVFSSGGPLPAEAARETETLLRTKVREVYGSTETGGVAYRRIAESDSWIPFRGIDVELAPDGRLVIRSDYLTSRDPFTTQDLAETDADGSFRLVGRADSVIKVEEKRVSLNDMAQRLSRADGIRSARVLKLQGRREYLGAVVVLEPAGWDRFYRYGRKQFVDELRRILSRHFSPILLPRKWRFVSSFPENDMSKVRRDDLEALFGPRLGDIDYEIEYLNLKDHRLECTVSFPPEHRFFQGHFPDVPILPGVAQVYTAMRMARRHLGMGGGLRDIPRMKFAKPIGPGERLRLNAAWDAGRNVLSFEYRTVLEDVLASKGSIRGKDTSRD